MKWKIHSRLRLRRIQKFTLEASHDYTLLQSTQGESYCNDGPIQDCRAVEERACSGATTTIRIECGAGRVCRSLRRQRSVKEEDASSFERQGPSRNPPGAKGAMGKSQGREEIAAEGKVAPASFPLRSGYALPALWEAGHAASFRTSLLDWRGAPPDHQC